MSSTKFQIILVIVIAFAVGFFAGSKFPRRGNDLTASLLDTVKEEEKTEAKGTIALVTKVIDGDTIEIEGGERVRYIGIDAPEIGGREQKTCYAAEAAVKNGELVKGKKVRVEKDTSERDPYGRLLGYVYVEEIFINLKLVEEGAALAASYPPDTKYAEKFLAAEEIAKKEGKGLWTACEIKG